MAVRTASRARSGARTGKERSDTVYRQLRILAGAQGGGFKAIAYRGSRKFLEVSALDPDEAVERLKEQIDALHVFRADARGDGVPTAEEYRDALTRLDPVMTPVQHAVLARHGAVPDGIASVGMMAAHLGVSEDAVAKAYSRLGRLIGDILDFHPEHPALRKTELSMLVLAEPVQAEAPEPRWILRESLREALAAEPHCCTPRPECSWPAGKTGVPATRSEPGRKRFTQVKDWNKNEFS